MSGANGGKAPSPRKRARLAAAGRLPYEPAAVQAAAFAGIATLLVMNGEVWFLGWRDLLGQAIYQPGDLSALLWTAGRLLVRTTGSLLAAALLCGWGMGWLLRRLTPPATPTTETVSIVSVNRGALGTAVIVTALCTTGLLLLTYQFGRSWMTLPVLRPEQLRDASGLALLFALVADLTIAAALFQARRRQFDRDEAMTRQEERDEAADDRGPETNRRAVTEAGRP